MYIYSKQKRKLKRNTFISVVILILILILFRLYQIYSRIDISNYNNVRAERLSETISEKNKEDLTITQMLENATNCVVGVSKIKDKGNTIFTTDGISKIGIGSGVIVSEKGYILTNEHVSGSKNSSCYITMEDGKNYNANVVWSDTNLDLSIIKINMKCVNYAKLGDSNNINVGETVYAIGNPIGFEFQKTVTSGIVSALNRTIIFKENEQSLGKSDILNDLNDEKEIYVQFNTN